MAATKQKVESGQAQISEVKMPRQKVVRDKLLEAKKMVEEGNLDSARLLSEAYHKEYWKEWGFETFSGYCDSELDTEYRKAKYLVDIWDAVKGLDLPQAKIAKLGWTKLKELAYVITKKNAEKLLKQAEGMSSRELTEAVKIMRQTGKSESIPDAPVTQTIRFTMGESEHRIIMEALNEAKRLCNNENLAVALEMICQDWLAQKGAHPEATPLEDFITWLESAYPVKIDFKMIKEKDRVQAKEAAQAVAKVEEKGKGKAKKAKLPDPDDLPSEKPGKEVNIDDLV